MSNEKNEVGFTAQHGPANTNDAPQQPQLSGVERSIFQKIADDVGRLVTEKNVAYGSAYLIQGKFLRLLFPEGVHVDRYEDLLLIVRIFDKQMRLARRLDMSGESPYQDISGYGILGVDLDSRRPGSTTKQHTPDVGQKVGRNECAANHNTYARNRRFWTGFLTRLREAIRATNSMST